MNEALVVNSQNDQSRAYAMPLEDIDVSNPELFRSNTMWGLLRALAQRRPRALL